MSKQKDLGRQLENRIAARAQAKGLPAKRHFMSGMNKEEPGDGHIGEHIVTGGILYEAKVRSVSMNARGEKSLTIPLDALRQVQKQATDNGYEQGILVVNPKSSSRPFAVVDLDWLLVLLAAKA